MNKYIVQTDLDRCSKREYFKEYDFIRNEFYSTPNKDEAYQFTFSEIGYLLEYSEYFKDKLKELYGVWIGADGNEDERYVLEKFGAGYFKEFNFYLNTLEGTKDPKEAYHFTFDEFIRIMYDDYSIERINAVFHTWKVYSEELDIYE